MNELFDQLELELRRIAGVNGIGLLPDGEGVVVHVSASGRRPDRGTLRNTDGKKLVTASRDKTAKVWDLAKKEVTATFPDHQAAVYGVAVKADGKVGFSVGADKMLRLWRTDGDGNPGSAMTACLEAAIAAPSIHNSQPWLFRAHGTAVDVLAHDLQFQFGSPAQAGVALSGNCPSETVLVVTRNAQPAGALSSATASFSENWKSTK